MVKITDEFIAIMKTDGRKEHEQSSAKDWL